MIPSYQRLNAIYPLFITCDLRLVKNLKFLILNRLAHILLKPMDISDVSLAARVREGQLQPSTFHAHVGAASFQGYLDPTVAETAVVFENEDYGGADGGRMGQLFSSAVRWVGSFAIVPLRWIFTKNISAGDTADCQLQGVNAGN